MTIYICGSRKRSALARQVMDAADLRGWTYHNWLRMDEMRKRGELRDSDALAANKRALQRSDGGILIEPAGPNGRAEAAYLAGLGKPVTIWLAERPYDLRDAGQLYYLLGRWETSELEKALGWLAVQIPRDEAEGAARV